MLNKSNLKYCRTSHKFNVFQFLHIIQVLHISTSHCTTRQAIIMSSSTSSTSSKKRAPQRIKEEEEDTTPIEPQVTKVKLEKDVLSDDASSEAECSFEATLASSNLLAFQSMLKSVVAVLDHITLVFQQDPATKKNILLVKCMADTKVAFVSADLELTTLSLPPGRARSAVTVDGNRILDAFGLVTHLSMTSLSMSYRQNSDKWNLVFYPSSTMSMPEPTKATMSILPNPDIDNMPDIDSLQLDITVHMPVKKIQSFLRATTSKKTSETHNVGIEIFQNRYLTNKGEVTLIKTSLQYNSQAMDLDSTHTCALSSDNLPMTVAELVEQGGVDWTKVNWGKSCVCEQFPAVYLAKITQGLQNDVDLGLAPSKPLLVASPLMNDQTRIGMISFVLAPVFPEDGA